MIFLDDHYKLLLIRLLCLNSCIWKETFNAILSFPSIWTSTVFLSFNFLTKQIKLEVQIVNWEFLLIEFDLFVKSFLKRVNRMKRVLKFLISNCFELWEIKHLIVVDVFSIAVKAQRSVSFFFYPKYLFWDFCSSSTQFIDHTSTPFSFHLVLRSLDKVRCFPNGKRKWQTCFSL